MSNSVSGKPIYKHYDIVLPRIVQNNCIRALHWKWIPTSKEKTILTVLLPNKNASMHIVFELAGNDTRTVLTHVASNQRIVKLDQQLDVMFW